MPGLAGRAVALMRAETCIPGSRRRAARNAGHDEERYGGEMDVLMPQLGETVAEGKISKWFVSAGDAVKPGDNLFEIETDKVSMEVPAIAAGTLAAIHVQAGEVAPVGAVVAVILGKGEAAALPPTHSAHPRESGESRSQEKKELDPRFRGDERKPQRCRRRRWSRSARCARPSATTARRACRAARSVTPLARRLAGEAGIDLANVKGSGPHGRIVARRRRRREDDDRLPRSRAALGRAGQGALSRCALRGNPARRHARHHRGAADAGADDPALYLTMDVAIGRSSRCAGGEARRQERTARPRHSLTISSSRPGRRRCSAFRPRTRSGPGTASCASDIPTSASRSRSKAA